MTWNSISENDFTSSLNAIEAEIYRTYAASNHISADRLQEIIDEVICFVRSMIASCEHNKLSIETNYIPCGFKLHAIAIMRHRLLSSLPKCKISEARKTEYEEAQKFFRDVACCKVRPEEPENARDNEAARVTVKKSAQVVTSRCKITGRKNLSGL